MRLWPQPTVCIPRSCLRRHTFLEPQSQPLTRDDRRICAGVFCQGCAPKELTGREPEHRSGDAGTGGQHRPDKGGRSASPPARESLPCRAPNGPWRHLFALGLACGATLVSAPKAHKAGPECCRVCVECSGRTEGSRWGCPWTPKEGPPSCTVRKKHSRWSGRV